MMGASLVTAIPLLVLFSVAQNRTVHSREAARVAEARQQEAATALNKIQSTPDAIRHAESLAALRRQHEQANRQQEQKIAALQSERDKLKSDAQASSRPVKEAEDKYDAPDLQLRNANGTLRELREELAARNEQQARTMQRLVETERQLRSAQAGNPRAGNQSPSPPPGAPRLTGQRPPPAPFPNSTNSGGRFLVTKGQAVQLDNGMTMALTDDDFKDGVKVRIGNQEYYLPVGVTVDLTRTNLGAFTLTCVEKDLKSPKDSARFEVRRKL